MNDSLEKIYRSHHASSRGEDFTLLGKERGAFLREHVGTGKRVADIGCRDGALTSTYAEGNEVLGVDIDAEALARAKDRLGIATLQMDLNGPWSLPEKSFDAVVACEVVEHLYYPDLVIEKAAKLLVPGGVLVGSVPNAFSLANRLRYMRKQKRFTPLSDPTHINHFTVSELEGLLANHFEEVQVIGLGRFGRLAEALPQLMAFDLLFVARVSNAKV